MNISDFWGLNITNIRDVLCGESVGFVLATRCFGAQKRGWQFASAAPERVGEIPMGRS